jgi:geranylgeranyl reductase family protein
MSGATAHSFDVIVVGGGPAGSVMGWVLAKQGIRVAVLERMRFPREKVCGDFVEPGGLRILARIGAMAALENNDRFRIERKRVYFGPHLAYKGPIRYYDGAGSEIDYGLVIPRDELDTALLQCASEAGAAVFSPVEARHIHRRNGTMFVDARANGRTITLRAPLVVGADGAESRVAQGAGLRRTDRRHIGVSQRVYIDGIDVDGGEATVWFDEDIGPGYGWMFPMSCGRANVGVGISADISQRFGINVRDAFNAAIERLRIRHPGCANLRIASKPLGGVVKGYAGIDRNHFDGGVLVGDAGSFADPVTGEGITQGMESAVLALPALMEALECGRFEADVLARFDRDFRRYFDPAMQFLGLSAAMVGNRYLAGFWHRANAHGNEEAAHDPDFARISGAIFGGPALQPLAVSIQMWTRAIERYMEGLSGGALDGVSLARRFALDFKALETGWAMSKAENPDWHALWVLDVANRLSEAQKTVWTHANPRPAGVFRFIGIEENGPSVPSSPLDLPDVQNLIVDGVRRLFEAGLGLLSSSEREPPAEDDTPRRRWRIKA